MESPRTRPKEWNTEPDFDGNWTSNPTRWMFPLPEFERITEDGWDRLVELMLRGDIGWVVFVPAGYRV